MDRDNLTHNPDSSCSIIISVKSKEFVDIMGKYEQLVRFCKEHCVKYHVVGDTLEIEAAGVPNVAVQDIGQFPDSLIEILTHLIESEGDNDAEDELYELEREVGDNRSGVIASITSMNWTCRIIGRGKDDRRFDRNLYDPDTLEKVYAEIAKKKGCPEEEITDKDFSEFVSGKTSIEEAVFTYDVTAEKKETYKQSFELSD